MITDVRLSTRAKKDLQKLPGFVRDKLLAWVDSVEHEGLEEVRKIPGYHDEPLVGKRKGQRSIRLTLSYRAIYRLEQAPSGTSVTIALILEINKHDY